MSTPIKFYDRPANVDALIGDPRSVLEFLSHKEDALARTGRMYARSNEGDFAQAVEDVTAAAASWLESRVKGSSPLTFTQWLATKGKDVAVISVFGDYLSARQWHSAVSAANAYRDGKPMPDAVAEFKVAEEHVRTVLAHSSPLEFGDHVRGRVAPKPYNYRQDRAIIAALSTLSVKDQEYARARWGYDGSDGIPAVVMAERLGVSKQAVHKRDARIRRVLAEGLEASRDSRYFRAKPWQG